jgi:L-ascorbate metabolism protein UlaG (beta-lactamase superfamily)
MLSRLCVAVSAALTLLAVGLSPARAAAPDRCLALVQAPVSPHVQRAYYRIAQLTPAEVRLSYIGHSTFLIESGGGVKIATDYNDYVRPAIIPDIVTMNRAHDTHYSNAPEPGIRYVLRGWNPDGGPAQHDLTFGDVRVRNVPTNIRTWGGDTYAYGNSIFVFEVAGLCIAHLGHLHHTLTTQQLAQIGQMDVVLVPVDGSYTLDLEGMIEVLKALKAPLMVPMHYFSSYTLERFLSRIRDTFEVVHQEVPTIVLSRAQLPTSPRVLVLPGR